MAETSASIIAAAKLSVERYYLALEERRNQRDENPTSPLNPNRTSLIHLPNPPEITNNQIYHHRPPPPPLGHTSYLHPRKSMEQGLIQENQNELAEDGRSDQTRPRHRNERLSVTATTTNNQDVLVEQNTTSKPWDLPLLPLQIVQSIVWKLP